MTLDFSLLKRKKAPLVLVRGSVATDTPVFRLAFDERGAFLQVTDKKGRESRPDYKAFSGHLRSVLRAIDSISKRKAFQLDWEGQGASDRLYLHEHDYLLDMVRHGLDLRDEEGRKLKFDNRGPGVLELYIQPPDRSSGKKGMRLKCQVRLVHGGVEIAADPGKLRMISERFVLSDHTVFEVQPLGANFEALPLFHTTITADDLPNILALASSSFDGLRICYQDYEVEKGEAIRAGWCIIFEDVDEFRALRLSVATIIPGFTPQFLRDYEIGRIVEVNDLERKLVIRDVTEEGIVPAVRYIRNLLARYRKKLGKTKDSDFYQDGEMFIIESGLAGPFLYGELEKLLERFTLLGTEKLVSYKIRPASRPSLRLRLRHGIDFLEGEGSIEIDGQEFSLAEMLRYYRKHGYVKLGDGTSVILERGYVQRLQRIFDLDGNKVRVSFFDLPVVDELIDEKTASATFPKAREIFQGFNTISSTRPRLPRLRGTLRPYQKYGYKWLRYLHRHGLGGCLADDMGLGKTLQAIALLASVKGKPGLPSLVVMPRTLLFNWEREIEKFAPQLSVYSWSGSNRDMEKARNQDIILTTYGLLRTGIETFRKEKFYYVILDESQAIKNLKSQTAKAVMLLDCQHRLALSGTPVENNLGELYSLFRFLNPGMFRTEKEFARRYGEPIQHHNDREAIRELRKKIYPFILRRLKQDVLSDLPEKVEQVLYVEMEPQQKKLYEERRLFYKEAIGRQIASHGIEKTRFFILQALMELRQIASCPEAHSDGKIISPKRGLLMEQIQDAVQNKHKVLVFANFLSVVESVTSDLEETGIPFLSMTGATRNRQELVERFQSDPSIKVFVMTLKTGGVGINLTKADTIFIFDPWWNVAAENQAIDRTHRIGQTRSVLCYRLICHNSIEEKMVELQEQKRRLFDSIIASDSGASKRLSEEDVEFILG